MLEQPGIPFQRPLRRLQQENGVAIVYHPADFVTAIAFGEEHIELRAHLDYTLFAQVEQERVWAPVLFPASIKTLKVRVLSPVCVLKCRGIVMLCGGCRSNLCS